MVRRRELRKTLWACRAPELCRARRRQPIELRLPREGTDAGRLQPVSIQVLMARGVHRGGSQRRLGGVVLLTRLR